MNVSGIVDLAMGATGRSDQQGFASTATIARIREFCRSANFPNDLYETELVGDPIWPEGTTKTPMPLPGNFVAPGGGPGMDYYDFRKVGYLKTHEGVILKEIQPSDVIKTDCTLKDTFYTNGYKFLVCNLSSPTTNLYMGAYLQPAMSFTETHWTLVECTEAILAGVIASIYKNVGDDDSGDRWYAEFKRLAREYKLDLESRGII